MRCRASCACRASVTISPHRAPCDLMRCSLIGGLHRTPRATGEQPPGFSGPHVVLDEAARVGSSSNKLGAAEGGAAIDGASKASHQRHTQRGSMPVASPCAGRKADAVSCGCSGRKFGPVQLRSSRGRRYGRRWRAALACCVSRGAAVQDGRGVCARSALWVGLGASLVSEGRCTLEHTPPAHPTRAALRTRA